MTRLFLTLFFAGTLLASAQDSTSLNWLLDLDEAQAIAKKEKKPILMYFTGSDWCAPCKQLKEDFFDTEKFAEMAENFVLMYVDYPRRQDIITEDQRSYNKLLILKYNKEGSFPTLVMLSAKGKVKDEISGYSSIRDTQYHYAFLERNMES